MGVLLFARATEITDTLNRNRPALPTLPAKGSTYVDPVFGKTILRVTDGTDGTSNETAYSYWPSLNLDSTRLSVISDGIVKLYDFSNMTIANKRNLFATSSPDGGLRGEDLIWSGTLALEMWGHVGTNLYKYHTGTGTYTKICDIVSLDAAFTGSLITQMSKSMDDAIVAFTYSDPGNGNKFGYAAINANTLTVLLRNSQTSFDEVQVDKTGRYLIYKTGAEGSIYDLVSSTHQDLTNGSPDYMMGHSDSGTGMCIGVEDFNGTWRRRDLATPHTHFQVFPAIAAYDCHLSLRADDETYCSFAVYDNSFSPANGALLNEIFLVKTDGSGSVRRLCHHRGGGPVYNDAPRANRSRDGNFIAYTSTWEGTLGTGRRDFFVVKVN